VVAGSGEGLLLHTCCAWCLLDVLDVFRQEYGRIVVAFFNPNIHPRAEFEKRLKSVRLLSSRLGLELVADGDYGLARFLSGLYNGNIQPAEQKQQRCSYCYRLRMETSVAEAATTLMSSPYQLTEQLVREGRAAALARDLRFDERRLVALHGRGRDSCPSGLKLHRQRYCGCIFSESEAFRPA
jgi:predicted adenine nucleotide alpha hydrolase (AANH) superfamily ATPase